MNDVAPPPRRLRVPYCPRCGYDLRAHLSDDGATCPECGRYSTYRELVPLPKRRTYARIEFVHLVLAIIPALVFWGVNLVIFTGLGAIGFTHEMILLGGEGLAMLLGAVACILVAMHIEARERPPTAQSARIGTLMAITAVVSCVSIVAATLPICCCVNVWQ